jgi:copper chaperone CopZ
MERNVTVQTELLKIMGMPCGACVGNVDYALTAVSGASDVKVSRSAGETTVQFDERLTAPDKLKSAVKGDGYGVDATNAAPRHH